MDWLQIILSLIGVLGLIVMLFYALRKLNGKIAVTSGSRMRVLDRINLGRDSMLLVVGVCGKLMLVGVTPQRIEKICDLETSEEEYLKSISSEGQDFRAVFSGVFAKKNEKTQENADEKKDDEDIIH